MHFRHFSQFAVLDDRRRRAARAVRFAALGNMHLANPGQLAQVLSGVADAVRVRGSEEVRERVVMLV